MTAALGASTKHPAKFSEPIIDRLRVLVQAEKRRVVGRVHDGPLLVVDPFAGVGRIHQLRATRNQIRTIGIELEYEWAACHPYKAGTGTLHGDMFEWLPRLVRAGDDPDVIATSPAYGNRFADSHNARDGSTRRSYTHDLGRKLSEGTSANLPWGPAYWDFHARAYRAMFDALPGGGLLLLNVSDFPRHGAMVPAVEWHRGACYGAGFMHGGADANVATKRLQGVGVTTAQAAANPDGPPATDARAPHEVILRLRKPEETPT